MEKWKKWKEEEKSNGKPTGRNTRERTLRREIQFEHCLS